MTATDNKKKIKPFTEFERFKKQLFRTDECFDIVRTGQSYEIVCENSKRKYSKIEMRKGMKYKGYHLCNLVRKQCELYMSMYSESFEQRMIDYADITHVHTQCYSEKGLQKIGNNFAFSIDINDCYWKTLYMLGYIDWYLFIEGLYDDNWKIGRNASIGSLIKKTYIYHFKGRKLIENRPEIKYPTQEYITIRNHVLTHVWNVFKGLIELIGDDFLMFFTDCVYVGNRQSMKVAIDYLRKAGYQVKIQHHEIAGFDAKKNMVRWDCMEERVFGQPFKIKYYQFNKQKQEISNILI